MDECLVHQCACCLPGWFCVVSVPQSSSVICPASVVFSLNLFHIWTRLGSYTSFVLRGLCLSEGCHQLRGHVAQLHSRTSKKNSIKWWKFEICVGTWSSTDSACSTLPFVRSACFWSIVCFLYLTCKCQIWVSSYSFMSPRQAFYLSTQWGHLTWTFNIVHQ